MKIYLCAAIPLVIFLAGCASISDLRKDKPYAQYSSKKSAKEFTACVSEKWESLSSHFTVNSRHTATGYAVSLSERVWNNNNIVFLLESDDQEQGSQSNLYKGYIISDQIIKMVDECK